MLAPCTDTALRLRAVLKGINPSQMKPISHQIPQFVFAAS